MIKKPYILGVDPGLSGAVAVLEPLKNTIISVFDMPLVASLSGKKTIDCIALSLKLGTYVDDVAFAIIEDVHAMPGQGVSSMFSFGVSKGIMLGMLGCALVPVFLTPPAVWKGVYGLSKNKDKSRELASKKFPLSKHLFELKKFDGRAEACLLAEFGKRFY